MNSHWTSTYDASDRARAGVMWRILLAYWVAATVNAILLPGQVASQLLLWIRPFTSKFDGIRPLAVRSFDPDRASFS
jgi:hypothetical protein